ncbi:hypothetical protein ACFV2H_31195 [Streptomyces sp. NPDC059629]|uniref:hypothetical protein n=1 Tax=Streptomyces sp. NPDC059629 TaxID=3346889 RepID=UPI0036B542AB
MWDCRGRRPHESGPRTDPFAQVPGDRAGARQNTPPAYWFGHGPWYADRAYEEAEFTPAASDAQGLGALRVKVRIRVDVSDATGHSIVLDSSRLAT